MSFGILIPGKPPITELEVCSETQLMLKVPEITHVTHLTVFAIQPPPLPEGFVYAIYLQQGHNPRICIGSIHASCNSISVGIGKYMTDKQVSYTGSIYIVITDVSQCTADMNDSVARYESADQSNQLLYQLGEHLANDLIKYIVSYEGVDHNGDQYVPDTVLAKWTDSYHQRIRSSSRFWRSIDFSFLNGFHQMQPPSRH